MILTETGESRVRGYLYVLERSLVLALPRDVAQDAVREIESHVRERVATVNSTDERGALEAILAELGSPLRVAQAYSTERVIDEAVITGRVVAVLRAMWSVAATSIGGFFAAVGLLVGYAIGLGFLAIAVMKPIFPHNVGLWREGPFGLPSAFGAKFPATVEPSGGYWIVPIALALGLGILVLTQHGARRFLAGVRQRWPKGLRATRSDYADQ